MSVRILIADDSHFWREQLRAVLEQGTDWTVFQATDGAEAVRNLGWIHPDIVILDCYMPVLDGLSTARELKRLTPELPVLIVTVDKSPFLEAAARESGVLAVFSKMECLEIPCFVRLTLQSRAA